MNYWLHRISHHSEASYPLLEKGYLTLGWICLANEDVIKTIEKGEESFRELFNSEGLNIRHGWSLWYFEKMKKGDIVVVPMYGGEFGIYEVVDEIKPIFDLAPLKFSNGGNEFEITSDSFMNLTESEEVDLGFYLKVKEINKTKREYADSKLIARMKMRQTNANINDIKDKVKEAMSIKDPKKIKEKIINGLSDVFSKEEFLFEYTPSKIEELVKRYFLRIGASYAEIPPKNDPSKKDGSDVDVVASFENLKIQIYVQVKQHRGESGVEAVEQISTYMENFYYSQEDNLVRIPWALTTGKFSEAAKDLAIENNIVLVEGEDFIRMLLDAGFSGIDV